MGASHQSKTKPGGTQGRGGRNHHHQEDQLTVKCVKPHDGMKGESADSAKRRIRAPQEANIMQPCEQMLNNIEDVYRDI